MIDAILSKYLSPSWRSTLGGIASMCLGLGAAANELLAGHWPSLESMGLISMGFTMLFVRDEKVSSEKAGAK
jgi:hypothetical protein